MARVGRQAAIQRIEQRYPARLHFGVRQASFPLTFQNSVNRTDHLKQKRLSKDVENLPDGSDGGRSRV